MSVFTADETEKHSLFLETLISVHYRDEWVSDLDALAAVASPKPCSTQMIWCRYCDHTESDRRARARGIPSSLSIGGKSCWRCPKGAAVVRAYRSWLARLATAAGSVKMGNRTILCPRDGCWACCERTFGHSSDASVGTDRLLYNTVYIL